MIKINERMRQGKWGNNYLTKMINLKERMRQGKCVATI